MKHVISHGLTASGRTLFLHYELECPAFLPPDIPLWFGEGEATMHLEIDSTALRCKDGLVDYVHTDTIGSRFYGERELERKKGFLLDFGFRVVQEDGVRVEPEKQTR